MVASSVEDLHSANNKLNKQNSLTEKGGTVNGVGDMPNTHDMLTGTNRPGHAAAADPDPAAAWRPGRYAALARAGEHDLQQLDEFGSGRPHHARPRRSHGRRAPPARRGSPPTPPAAAARTN